MPTWMQNWHKDLEAFDFKQIPGMGVGSRLMN